MGCTDQQEQWHQLLEDLVQSREGCQGFAYDLPLAHPNLSAQLREANECAKLPEVNTQSLPRASVRPEPASAQPLCTQCLDLQIKKPG